MKKYSSALLLFVLGLLTFGYTQAQYKPDYLGNEIEFQTLQMPNDYEGPVQVNVVRRSIADSKKAIVYVHGFCDFFFNVEMAKRVNAQGYQFYAIDLRKYGRSWLPHQKPNQCRDLSEYYADIDTALAMIKNEGIEDITLLAHSTGGLTTSLYMKHGKNKQMVNHLVLNSPFLDMNDNWLMENIVIPIVSFLGKFFPEMKLPAGLSGLYGESIHKDYKGEWDYRLDWKPILAFRMDAGWLRAIHKGHQEVQDGLQLEVPILLMHSDKTIRVKTWDDTLFTGDAVLDVEDIHKYGLGLGSNVQEAIIANGLHDLSLSREAPRREFYKGLFSFLAKE